MFTGLILEKGRIARDSVSDGKGGVRLEIDLSPALGERLPIGASLAVSGVCLTIVETVPAGDLLRVAVELSPETIARTALGELCAGSEVNLEPALRMGDPLGGHWVQGHVDGTARVVARRDLDAFRVLGFSIPEDLAAYLVEKGSVTVDGVSLTVSALRPDSFEVALIPHTLEATTLGSLVPGDRVHLEVDVLAKYVERALAARGLVREAP
ncbi:MAG TPA: riboflavin synthase [Thermoanaerobaculia bacterium]|nr:riboflavin synthase [Thermoanaerobaculia bacterium]